MSDNLVYILKSIRDEVRDLQYSYSDTNIRATLLIIKDVLSIESTSVPICNSLNILTMEINL